jgi:hypothetical protein
MSWTWREYDPFSSAIAERGPIEPKAALELFGQYDWNTPLTAMRSRPKEVQYAPGFEITDSSGRTFYIGGAGDSNGQSFVLGYTRPRIVRKLTITGIKKKLEPQHYSDIEIQSAAEVEQLLVAFLEGRATELDQRFG